MKTGYELLLPDGILETFEVSEVIESDEDIILSLKETPLSKSENIDSRYYSKGFYPPVDIYDFPLRGKRLILRIFRRRWRDNVTGNPYMRKIELVTKGTHLTEEFASFLKESYR